MILDEGKYIVKNIHVGLDMLREYISKGYSGLLVTRQHPRMYADLQCTTIWLSQNEDKSAIDPQDLPRLCHTIVDFLEKNSRPVVLFEGFEYVLVQNNFQTLLKYLYMINDFVNIHGALFLLVVNPRTLQKAQLSILRSEFEFVPEEGARR